MKAGVVLLTLLSTAGVPALAVAYEASAETDCDRMQQAVAALADSDEGGQAMLTRYSARLCRADEALDRSIEAIGERLADDDLRVAFASEQVAWRQYRDARCAVHNIDEGGGFWPRANTRACQLAESKAHADTLAKLQQCLGNTTETERHMLVDACAFGERDAAEDQVDY